MIFTRKQLLALHNHIQFATKGIHEEILHTVKYAGILGITILNCSGACSYQIQDHNKKRQACWHLEWLWIR